MDETMPDEGHDNLWLASVLNKLSISETDSPVPLSPLRCSQIVSLTRVLKSKLIQLAADANALQCVPINNITTRYLSHPSLCLPRLRCKSHVPSVPDSASRNCRNAGWLQRPQTGKARVTCRRNDNDNGEVENGKRQRRFRLKRGAEITRVGEQAHLSAPRPDLMHTTFLRYSLTAAAHPRTQHSQCPSCASSIYEDSHIHICITMQRKHVHTRYDSLRRQALCNGSAESALSGSASLDMVFVAVKRTPVWEKRGIRG
ncbi:hypothetical protein H2248_001657 [Termitomyces sp. 'cryptogamus']|nr:hypothetical protein H2248_001657 [Termitomyces sp. 'cryptogamus']